ncbi:MAG: ribulose-phosphate 3-epimerase [Spirochaetota bacterium]|nr:ribulose-phosphate 3-epimerase [Spirochaetota bacterium]
MTTTKQITIAPSILSANFSSILEELDKLSHAGIEMVHFDVMDNHFVPNLTFGPKFIKDLRDKSELIFDVHLMIENPEDSVEEFLDTGGDIFTYHIEAISDIMELIRKVKGRNKQFSLSVKPKTPVETIYPYLEHLDMVLIMSVEPGFGGQSLIPETLSKVSAVKQEISARGLKCKVQVDGGVNLSTLPEVVTEGADILVMGSAFFKNNNYKTFVDSVYQTIDSM